MSGVVVDNIKIDDVIIEDQMMLMIRKGLGNDVLPLLLTSEQ